MLVQRPQQHPVHGFELLDAQPFTNHTQTGMIRRRLREAVSQIAADGQALSTPAGNGPLAGQILEKSHRQHLQRHHRINAGTPSLAWVRIGRLANIPDLAGKTNALQGLVHPPVKPIRSRRRPFASHHPEFLLLFTSLASFKHTFSRSYPALIVGRLFNRLLDPFSALEEVNDENDQRYNQKEVDEAACHMKGESATPDEEE